MKRPNESTITKILLLDDLIRDPTLKLLMDGLYKCRNEHDYNVRFTHTNPKDMSYGVVLVHDGGVYPFEIDRHEIMCAEDVVTIVEDVIMIINFMNNSFDENNLQSSLRKDNPQPHNEFQARLVSLQTALREMFNVNMNYQTAVSVFDSTKIVLTYRDYMVSFVVNNEVVLTEAFDDMLSKYVADLIMHSVRSE